MPYGRADRIGFYLIQKQIYSQQRNCWIIFRSRTFRPGGHCELLTNLPCPINISPREWVVLASQTLRPPNIINFRLAYSPETDGLRCHALLWIIFGPNNELASCLLLNVSAFAYVHVRVFQCVCYSGDLGPMLSQARDSLIKVELIDESDYSRLQGKIVGPPGTPFHGERVGLVYSNLRIKCNRTAIVCSHHLCVAIQKCLVSFIWLHLHVCR